MLYKCLATGRESSCSPTEISTLIYETHEECNEVKKNKRKERKKTKQALHCDSIRCQSLRAVTMVQLAAALDWIPKTALF